MKVTLLRNLACWAGILSSVACAADVRELQSDILAEGTEVRNEFDFGFMFGIVSEYEENLNVYEVEWADGSLATFDANQIQTLVEAANDVYQPHPPGTRVRKIFEEERAIYVWGTIESYNTADRTYVIGFDNDGGNSQTFDDRPLIDMWVISVGQYQPYPLGTSVRHQFRAGWFFGMVTAYDADAYAYSVEWSDGDKKVYKNLGLMDRKVAAAGAFYEPYQPGVPLYRDGKNGTILVYSSVVRQYTAEFEPNQPITLGNLDLVDQYVKAYNDLYNPFDGEDDNKDSSIYDPLEDGTKVRRKVDGGYYMFGEILEYNDDAVPFYRIRFSNSDEITDINLDRVERWARLADELYDPQPNNTPVRRYFRDSQFWFFGVISSYNYDTQVYRVTFSDGDKRSYDDLDEIDTMVADAFYTYTPYDLGTSVQDEDGLTGFIFQYSPQDMTYIIEWNGDGSKQAMSDLSRVDKLVNRVKAQAPAEVGSLVREYRESEDKYYWGEITDYDDATSVYTVRWTDGKIETFAGDDEVSSVVKAARTFNYYEFGTQVRKIFQNKWYFGEVQTYDADAKAYTIKWSDDSESTISDFTEMDEIVRNAGEKYFPYAVGTRVYHRFGSDGYFWGTITEYNSDDQVYTISWSDGSLDSEGDLEDIDEWANRAIANIDKDPTKNGGGRGDGGPSAAVLSTIGVVVVALIVGIATYCRRGSQRETTKASAEEPCDDFDDIEISPPDDLGNDPEAPLPEVS